MKLGKQKAGKAIPKELTKVQKEKRNRIKIISISSVIALILLVALFLIEDAIVNKEITKEVYQASKTIEENTHITEENFDEYFHIKNTPLSVIPENCVSAKEDIVNKYTAHQIEANSLITSEAFVDKLSVYLQSIEKPVELSVNIGNLGAIVSGTLREGDFINVYGLRKQENQGDTVSYFISSDTEYVVQDRYTFEHIMVTQAFNSSGNSIASNSNDAVTMFNITIEESDAQKFAEMLANCSITIAKATYVTDDTYVGYIPPTTDTNNQQSANNFDQTSNETYDMTVSEDNNAETAGTEGVNNQEQSDTYEISEEGDENTETNLEGNTEEIGGASSTDEGANYEGLGPYTIGETNQANEIYNELINEMTGNAETGNSQE